MSIEELRKKFIVEDDVLRNRLEAIATKALVHCVVDKKGAVHFNNPRLTGREKLRLTLAARAIASQMESGVRAEVSVAELSENCGVPKNQVRARAADLINEKSATSRKRGYYTAVPHKVEALLDSIGMISKKA
ncbi:MAG: hypothetical protein ABSC88_08240 [Terracidiphilus sp.]|jgi:hypothetical protein